MPNDFTLPSVTIDPNGVYHEGPLSLALDIPPGSFAKARRDGHLRYVRKGRRVLYLGRWLLDWLESATVQTEPPADQQGAQLCAP